MLPSNVAFLLNLPDYQATKVAAVIKDHSNLQVNLVNLSSCWPIRVWFKKPVTVVNARRKYVTVSEFTFSKFFAHGDSVLCHLPKRDARSGFVVNFNLDDIEKYEVVLFNEREFKSFDAFKARFDLRLITERQILKLWSLPSAQTGKQYCQTDFKRLGPEALVTMQRFLRRFTSIDTPVLDNYNERGYMSEHYTSNHHLGRDITIESNKDRDWISYASEFSGTGNGSYGLIATEKTWLHLEDD